MSTTIQSFYTVAPKKVSGGSTPPPAVAVKYHTGMYVAQFKNTNLASTAAGMPLDEFNDYPCLRGWMVRYSMRDLEGSLNNYTIGFNKIDAVLALLPAGKRLVILIEFKTGVTDPIDTNDHIVPDYMLNATYGGGEWIYKSTNALNGPNAGGHEMCLFNENVRLRLEALAVALGNRYNGNDKFEGIALTEGALQEPRADVVLSADWEQQSWIGLLRFVTQMRSSFPNCLVIMYLNYKTKYLNRAINGGVFGTVAEGQYTTAGIKNLGIALGGPDVVEHEYGLGGVDSSRTPSSPTNPPGVYAYYADMNGQIPLCPSMQRTGFLRTQIVLTPGGIENPPVSRIVNYAKDNLFANYLFVTRAVAGGGFPDSWITFLAYLNANPAIRDSVNGGMSTTKPACYSVVTTT